MKPTRSLLLFAGSLAALFISDSAHAADLTWDNATATGNWNTIDSNFTGAWTNGNTAVFGGTAGSTVTINEAAISATGLTFNVNNDSIARTGTNTLTLSTLSNTLAKITVNDGLSATISAPIAGSVAFSLDSNNVSGAVGSGGTLTTSGVNTITAGSFIIGATSSGNTWNLSNGGTIASGTGVRSLYIGNEGFGNTSVNGLTTTGNNRVFISTPGSVGTPTLNISGNGGRMTMGYASSGNSLTINNGAYVAQTTGGGTNTWTIGDQAGANSNAMTIDGANSQVVFGSNQIIDVGKAGSSNSLTVSNGGLFRAGRLGVGDGGGSFNSATVIGNGAANSATVTLNGAGNGVFEIGSGTGANSNFVSVQAGGVINLTASGTSRNFSIGGKGTQNAMAAGGDSNYLEVTGANSAFNMTTALPLAVGGTINGAGPGVPTDGGNNNQIKISSGATMTLTSTSLYVLGSVSTGNTTVKLGDGTGTSTLTVGATANYTAGVLLSNANGRLEINSGRLTAGAAGALVSGAGKVNLLAAAYVSTAFASTISTEITGVGSLTKEGAGTLDLTYLNTYTGNTTVTATGGVLKMENAYLADASTVNLFTGGKLNLNTTGATDTIAALYLDGVLQTATGTWGSSASLADNKNDTFFSGTGMLLASAVPEPTAALLGGLGLLSLLRRRRSTV